MRDLLAILALLTLITLGMLHMGYLTTDDLRGLLHGVAVYVATQTEG